MADEREIVNELTVVTKLWNLCCDVDNRPYIARRGIIPTLMKFLQHKQGDVSCLAADTLRLLAQHPDNKEYMCRTPNLVNQLLALAKSEKADAKAKQAAVEVLKALSSAAAGSVSPAKESGEASPEKQAEADKPKMYTSTLTIVKNSSSKPIEEILVGMVGVVSFSVKDKTVQVYAKQTAEVVNATLRASDVECTIVQEVDQAVQEKAPAEAKEATYIGEDEVFSEYQQSLVVSGNDSLAARLERQQKERQAEMLQRQQQQGSMSRFFRKLTSAIW